MKITLKQLKQLIKEAVESTLEEGQQEDLAKAKELHNYVEKVASDLASMAGGATTQGGLTLATVDPQLKQKIMTALLTIMQPQQQAKPQQQAQKPQWGKPRTS